MVAVSIDYNGILVGLAFSAAVSIALGAVTLYRFLVSRRRETSQEQSAWAGFPGKHGLELKQSSPGATVHEGSVDGCRLIIKQGAAHAPQDDRKLKAAGPGYVAIWAQCTRPQPAGLQLWKETTHDVARKETRKLNEVIIGDAELDNALIIRGKHAGEIKALLCQAEVRKAVLEFFENWPMSIVSDYWVKCEEDTAHAGFQSPEAMLKAALELARTLDQYALKPQGLR